MIIKTKITKEVYANGDYRVFGCVPLDNKGDVVCNKYGNFTITGDLPYLAEGRTYTLDITKSTKSYNNGVQYDVIDVPSFKNDIDVTHMSEKDDLMLLKEITSKNLVDVIHKAYPNYCSLILNNKSNTIDLNNIKGVKEARHKSHIRKLNARFKYYQLQKILDYYKLSLPECKSLYNIYETDADIKQHMMENPYYCLISICKRSFRSVDKLILAHDRTLISSNQRCEFFILDVLSQNENIGNTYMNAVDMAKYLDKYVLAKSKDVSIKSEAIYYDEKTNRIAIGSTYSAEKNIADFIINKINNPIELDWDCENFRGNLTDEQMNVLKMFCDNNILILDASAGTGKTTTMLSLIQMLEAYNYTYKLFAPTGKAAKRLSESTNREANTIHRGTAMGSAKMEDDVFIIDEASMLNLETASMVFNSITNENAKILLLCDIEQLPPIGLGCIARELINSGKVPMCTLTKVFRFSSGGMIKTTTLARKGQYYLNDLYDNDSIVLGDEKDYKFIKSDNTAGQIIDTYLDFIDNGISYKDIVILSARNIGEFGTYHINNLIQQNINPIVKGDKVFKKSLTSKGVKYDIQFHTNDLVLVTKNNYNMLSYEDYDEMNFEGDGELTREDMPQTSIFNGEIGVVTGFDHEVMIVQIDDKSVVFYPNDVQNLLLGYCTTIYKFQGSQIDYPIVLTLKAYSNQLSKNLLYTCLSRGQKKVTEIGEVDAVKYSLNTKPLNNNKNLICEMIKEDM